jgi:ABC-2 type transport system ATP-binding protein
LKDTAIIAAEPGIPEVFREGLEEPDRDGRDTVITVKDLRKSYSGTAVVDGVSFEVRRGEIFGLLGPNGAGKTTTTEIIEGLRDADGGHVSLLGLNGLSHSAACKERIGIQLQAPSLLPLLTVEEHIALFGRVYRHCLPAKQVMEFVGLSDCGTKLTKNLSGGQQQRLSVALALVNDPEIAFLDEPSTGLDPQSRRGLWETIEAMKAGGKTIFLTTHFMEEAERLCDRLAIMDHGRIIAQGAPQQLIDTYFPERAIQFDAGADIDMEVLERMPGATRVTTDNGEAVIYSADIPATITAVLQYAGDNGTSSRLKNLNVRQSTLEDVFIKLTGRRIRN